VVLETATSERLVAAAQLAGKGWNELLDLRVYGFEGGPVQLKVDRAWPCSRLKSLLAEATGIPRMAQRIAYGDLSVMLTLQIEGLDIGKLSQQGYAQRLLKALIVKVVAKMSDDHLSPIDIRVKLPQVELNGRSNGETRARLASSTSMSSLPSAAPPSLASRQHIMKEGADRLSQPESSALVAGAPTRRPRSSSGWAGVPSRLSSGAGSRSSAVLVDVSATPIISGDAFVALENLRLACSAGTLADAFAEGAYAAGEDLRVAANAGGMLALGSAGPVLLGGEQWEELKDGDLLGLLSRGSGVVDVQAALIPRSEEDIQVRRSWRRRVSADGLELRRAGEELRADIARWCWQQFGRTARRWSSLRRTCEETWRSSRQPWLVREPRSSTLRRRYGEIRRWAWWP